MLLGIVAVGCGGEGKARRAASEQASESPRRTEDAAVTIARSLPPGASRCTVTRPGRVASRKRALLQRISQGDPLAWLAGVPVRAYARAEHVADDGSRPAVALIRFAVPARSLRAKIDERAPVRLVWGEQGCAGERCRALRARFVGPRTLRVERGKWPVSSGAGVEQRCAELATASPEAVEVASRRGPEPPPGTNDPMPRRIDTLLHAGGRDVTVQRRRRMATLPAARKTLRKVAQRRHELGGVPAIDAQWQRRRALVIATLRFRWEDLALAAEDERRVHRARAERRHARMPDPVARVDVTDLAEVRQQVRLRRERLDTQTGPGRIRRVEQLRRLLERAVDAHPDEIDLARQLAELLLKELEDGEAAGELARRITDRAPPEPQWWRRARREAAALRSRADLAALLVDHGIVAPSDAARAARDLASLRQRGLDYRWVEAAWSAANALAQDAKTRPLRSTTSAALPVRSLLETFVTLGELGVLPGGRSLYVLVRPDSYDGPLRARRHARLLEVHTAGDDETLFAASPTGSPKQLRVLGEWLARVLEAGPAEVTVAFASGEGMATEPQAVVRLAGEVEGDRLVVGRATGQFPWADIARYVARPLSAIEDRVFPPPAMELEAPSAAVARRVVELAADRPHVRCRTEGTRVQCKSSVERPAALRGLVERFAGEQLGQ